MAVPTGTFAEIVIGNGKSQTSTASSKLKGLDDIKNKRIGVLLGSVHDTYATKNFPGAKILQYQNRPDLLNALNLGKVETVFTDQSAVKEILSKNPSFGVLVSDVYSVPIAAGFNKESKPLREQFNLFLQEIMANGTYNDMVDRWMKKNSAVMPEIRSSNENGTLRAGIVGDLGAPFSFIQDGVLMGFDIELSKRFAAKIGKEFVPVDMPFGSLIASISTMKIDLITASMMISEERKKKIDFSEPYYESGVSLLAKRANIEQVVAGKSQALDDKSEQVDKVTFSQKISNSFYNNIILEKRYLLILDGLKITLIISLFAALFGSIIGGFICFMRMSKRRFFSEFAKLFIALLRGTPVLVLLMIIYYIVFASVNINPIVVAVFAFGLNFGAYVSEMFRTSIESIDKGQNEAAIAGGFTKIQSFIHIILPQALRNVLPVYKGEFISLIKMTSVVGYIAVQDLTKASDIIRSRTFDAFFPLIMVAVFYLIIAWLLTLGLGRIEVSVDPKRRRINKIEEAN